MTPEKQKKVLCFSASKGAVSDGHKYAADVIAKGAKVLVVQNEVEAPKDVTVIKVADSRYAMAMISAAYFDYPAEKMKVIGITGTKGKTTTTYMIRSILESAGHKVGLIGTIEAIIGEEHIPAANTTPESYTVQSYFDRMVKAGCDCVVMEVSSQGLMLHRTAGIPFEIGIFTNIEPDHIGPAEHASFEDYMHCKGLLFQQCKLGIVNMDDKHLEQVLKVILAGLRHLDSQKKQIFVPKTQNWYQDRVILVLITRRKQRISIWMSRLISRVNSASTTL